eukprot:gb/GECG01015938.1/.p1 GENE.gb/GECG01015938.1/~~gb/GECG01015938.1/.p1  ORF type:complete len:105 (+),score=8.27 gb/GECG01015938.1/:1-315(+)
MELQRNNDNGIDLYHLLVTYFTQLVLHDFCYRRCRSFESSYFSSAALLLACIANSFILFLSGDPTFLEYEHGQTVIQWHPLPVVSRHNNALFEHHQDPWSFHQG